jgi:hypothetical protein
MQGSRYGLGFWLHATGPGVTLEGGYDAGVSFRTVHDRDSDTTGSVRIRAVPSAVISSI